MSFFVIVLYEGYCKFVTVGDVGFDFFDMEWTFNYFKKIQTNKNWSKILRQQKLSFQTMDFLMFVFFRWHP